MTTVTENDLKRVEDKIDRLSNSMDKITDKIDKLAETVTQLAIGQVEIKGEIKALEENLNGQIKTLNETVKGIDKRVEKIETNQDTLVKDVSDLKGVKSLIIPIIVAVTTSLLTLLIRAIPNP